MVRLGKQLLPLFALGLMASFAQAQTLLCTETDSGATQGNAANGLNIGGCVASVPVDDLGTPIQFYFASDGEVPFDPFGFGGDTTDGIILNSNWKQDPSSSWKQFTGTIPGGGTNTAWALPASIPNCGAENEPVCEPIGMWTEAGGQWNGTFVYTMLSQDGNWSDTITFSNIGPVGSLAAITFESDPVPEPTSLGFLAAGAVVLVGALKRRKAAEAKNATL